MSYIRNPPAITHSPPIHFKDLISCLRRQRCYFLRHCLRLPMALRWMANGERPNTFGSCLFRSSQRLPLCRAFCAPVRRWRAIYEVTLLVACRRWMGHFRHRLFVLAGLGAFATLDWRVYTCSIGGSRYRRIDQTQV